MPPPRHRLIDLLPGSLRAAILGPPALAFGSAMMLAAFWFGGETAMFALGFIVPASLLILYIPLHLRLGVENQGGARRDPMDSVRAGLDSVLRAPGGTGMTAALAIAIDDSSDLTTRHGAASLATLHRTVAQRLTGVLRDGDILAPDGTAGFVVALAPTRRLDTEALIQLSARAQRVMADPVPMDGFRLHATLSVGFCLPRRPAEMEADACLSAARTARTEALRNGPGGIRAFNPAMRPAPGDNAQLARDIETAFDAGQITAWFQPQLCTDTGAVSGMEALARWNHPDHGVLLPGQFLPIVAAHGLQRRLTETILDDALAALRQWDAAGCGVPGVAVNFATRDLADPMLAERLAWELDRFGLLPARLTVEVLESVIADGEDDITTRNLTALSRLGCRIDLDDFGTGQTALANIRRFSVGRIKIDRAFVTGIETDPDKQTMLAAILELAHRLNVETLAEGVETVEAHAILAQLGCAHVQGHVIARPMPGAETEAWLLRHRQKLAATHWVGRQAG